MKQSALLLLVFFLFSAACGIPEDRQPNTITSPISIREGSQPESPASEENRKETIYLFDENNQLAPVQREIPVKDLRVTDLINELVGDLTELERNAVLSTAVPVGLSLSGVEQDNDIATINFNAGGLEVLEGEELTKALAQIVWTLTETGSLSEIRISIEGDMKTWPTPDGGDQQLLRRIQFISYAPEVTRGITQ